MKNNVDILKLEKLSKSFQRHFYSEKKRVLKDLTFSIPQGSCVGFLGANGSGKTTTFKCILELIKKDSGQVYFKNKILSFKDKSNISFLPERPQFYEELTAQETLYFYSSLKKKLNLKLKEEIEQGLKKLGLYSVRHKPLKTFSKGMLQKVGILQALIPQSELLILDEPFSGLDPESRFTCMELLEEKLKKGTTLFLSSHIFQDVEKICDRLIILKQGSIIFDGAFLDFYPFTSSRKQKIIYFMKGRKNHIYVSYKEAKEELKKLLSKGAEILSVQSEAYNLEEKYKELMKKV
ncbi:MAG: ABC transporter ATP-binding protein [Bdellovibrionales bacterium]|nr:ABC transporter ATP-binding protein [Bdellovibrionales bacterium]